MPLRGKTGNRVKKAGTPAAPTNAHGLSRDELNQLAKENLFVLFNGVQIRILFDIGESAMTRFRKLASKERGSDPWINDKTRPEKFNEWLWSKRIQLETDNPTL